MGHGVGLYLCNGVYLDCASWCLLVSLCVCDCHGVYLLACSMTCPTHLTWGRVSMSLAPPVEGLEMYFPPPGFAESLQQK